MTATTFANLDMNMQIGLRQAALQLSAQKVNKEASTVVDSAAKYLEFLVNGGADIEVKGVNLPAPMTVDTGSTLIQA